MNKKELEKLPYMRPECHVIEVEDEQFICTSVVPQVPGSTEEEWDNEQETDVDNDDAHMNWN